MVNANLDDSKNLDERLKKKNDNNIKKLNDEGMKEFLLKEIEVIQNQISKYDDYSLIVKGWAITIWAGIFFLSLAESARVEYKGFEYQLILVSCIPFIFWIMDSMYKFYQRVSIGRSNLIADILNDRETKFKLPDPKKENEYKFPIYDPVGRLCKKISNNDYKEDYLSEAKAWNCIGVRNVSFLYVSLIEITLVVIFIRLIIIQNSLYWLVLVIIIPLGVLGVVWFCLSAKDKL